MGLFSAAKFSLLASSGNIGSKPIWYNNWCQSCKSEYTSLWHAIVHKHAGYTQNPPFKLTFWKIHQIIRLGLKLKRSNVPHIAIMKCSLLLNIFFYKYEKVKMAPCMCWQKNWIDLLAVICNVFPRGIDMLLHECTSKNEAETFVLIMSKTWASNSAYGRCTDVPDHSLQPVASISSHQFFLPLCSFLVRMWKTVHTSTVLKN